MSNRARAVAQQAIPQARQAGTTVVLGVRQGVEGARGWTAPRMHDAADAITASVAPKVSSALHSAAKTVEPAAPARTGIRRLLDWRVLLGIGLAAVAASAAAAVAMRQHYESATMAAKDAADNVADMAGEVSGKVSDKAEEAARRTDVNGKVPHTAHK
jgi:hypothetical protein